MDELFSLPIVTLKPKRALPFFSQHPWMYANAIKTISETPDVGDAVLVQTHDGKFVGYGLYNPHSKIRVRMYSWSRAEELDDEFWGKRIIAAAKLRERLFQGSSSAQACRLIFSEADRLSGLIVDRFADWLVLQWTSAALATRQKVILEAIQELFQPKGIWLRTEKGIRELEGLELEDGLLAGEKPPRPLFVEENSLQFGVDLIEGQKTGFYFDQRDNRQVAASYAANARVLDVCCYTGSFALNAAKVESCRRVDAIDSSESALEMARRNADLNDLGTKIHFQQADMFESLEELNSDAKKYDLVILDPPKLARTRGGLNRAAKAYVRLNRLAMQLISENGILMTCSCSGHVSREDFEQIIAQAALESGRNVQILEQRGQAVDHPVATSCLETNYLKAFLCRVE